VVRTDLCRRWGLHRMVAFYRRGSSNYSPLIAIRAERSGIMTVVPLSVTRCLFLKSLSVRVIVSRVDHKHAAICSWVNGTLIWFASVVCCSPADQCRKRRASFSWAVVERPMVRSCSQARPYCKFS